MSLLEAGRKEIERQVEATVAPGKRGALLFIATEDGGTFAVAAKLADGWKVEARAHTDWSKPSDVTGEVRIVGSW